MEICKPAGVRQQIRKGGRAEILRTDSGMGIQLGIIKTLLSTGAAKSAVVVTGIVVVQVAVITTVKLNTVQPQYATADSTFQTSMPDNTLSTQIQSNQSTPTITTPVTGTITSIDTQTQPTETTPTTTEGTSIAQETDINTDQTTGEITTSPIDSLLNDILIPERLSIRTPYIP